LGKYTKIWKNISKFGKIYQNFVDKSILKLSIPRPFKSDQNWDFWYENILSGNHVCCPLIERSLIRTYLDNTVFFGKQLRIVSVLIFFWADEQKHFFPDFLLSTFCTYQYNEFCRCFRVWHKIDRLFSKI
jgi:hypothetical protein